MNTRSTPRVLGGHRGRGGEGVVRLLGDHGPDRDAERLERLLEQRELRHELGVDSRTGLVAGPQSFRKDSITWSVATPTWVAPSSRIVTTVPSTPPTAPTSCPVESRREGTAKK